MNDPISEMNETEIQEACWKIVSSLQFPNLCHECLFGLIIKKLQEWDHVFRWNRDGWVVGGSCYHETSLPRAFIKAAVILGKWSPTKKVEEPDLTLEQRVQNLEKIILFHNEQFPDLR